MLSNFQRKTPRTKRVLLLISNQLRHSSSSSSYSTSSSSLLRRHTRATGNGIPTRFFTSTTASSFAMPGALNIREHIMNVNDRPLVQHGTSPITGYFRTGFCETDASDFGHHLIAGIVTEEFLDFSARRGNNLRSAGLTGGCRWCLCVSRWKEAFDAFKGGQVERSVVPKVDLEATHRGALRQGVTLEELQEFSNR